MNRRVRLFVLSIVAAIALTSAACGDDDNAPAEEEAPPLTNELGVETFEPGADPFDTEQTVEPG